MPLHEYLQSQGFIVSDEELEVRKGKNTEVRWINETAATGGVHIPLKETSTLADGLRKVIEAIGSGVGISGEGRIKTKLGPSTQAEEVILTEK